MRNRKTYLTFDEAFRKKGLVPRFRDMADQLNFQDAYMTRLLANNELIGKLHHFEKGIGGKLVVRSNHGKLYDMAKEAKWIPYHDPYLRSYVVGTSKAGKPIWSTTKAPALVHPELSSAIQSIFTKDAYKPSNLFWRTYDTSTEFLRYAWVSVSGFHLVPLIESFTGGKGIGVLNIPKWVGRGKRLLKDPEFMTEAKGAGLRTRAPSDAAKSFVESRIRGLVNRLEAQGGFKKVVGRGIDVVSTPQRWLTSFLFNEYQPLLKVNMYYDYKYKWLKHIENKRIKLSKKELTKAQADIAKVVNDQFGSQAWELMRHLNDPTIRKYLHRAIGYPDWTISALRQAAGAFQPGVRGFLGRRYWLRYVTAFVGAQQAMSYINTGFYNDPEDGSIKWSWEKAHSTFENKDPRHKLDFQLPDVEITILGKKFNPGRETKVDPKTKKEYFGRRYYSHFGKQMLEIPRYATDFFGQLFAKSNPIVQITGRQIMGGSPYKGEIFPARGAYAEGEYRPWGATEPLTKARVKERALGVVEQLPPFSIRAVVGGKYATVGMTPISKGLSLYDSRKHFEKALLIPDKDKKKARIEEITAVLEDGGYKEQSIKRTIGLAKSSIKRKMGYNDKRNEILRFYASGNKDEAKRLRTDWNSEHPQDFLKIKITYGDIIEFKQ